jgi:predicted tellurium resistance membrane protein TerC
MFASAVEMSSSGLWSLESAIALLALTMMEIVLGIDNIVFIAIITGRLPEAKQAAARRLGLLLAMGMRIVLLLMIDWVMSLESALLEFSAWTPFPGLAEWFAAEPEINELSGRDLILLGGGLFLLYTAVREIHHKVEGDMEGESEHLPQTVTMGSVLFRIALMDAIFSLDSVITAVGMAKHIPIMITAVVISVGVMIAFANQISEFVQRHPTVKMLALSFLLLIAVVLVSEAVGTPISKGYVYFAMAFSLAVEFLNLRMRAKRSRPSVGEGEVGVARGQTAG